MKKLLCTCLTLCLLCGTALADVLWEPESSFYQRNQDACVLEQRAYYTNSPEGCVTLWDAPGGNALAVLPNGETLHVYYRYQESGGDWGVAEISTELLKAAALTVSGLGGDRWVEVWVPMEDMTLKYDHQSFLEDHADSVRDESRTVDLSGLNYCVYPYPGGALSYQRESGEAELQVTLSPLYTDEAGREWGCCGYLYGDRDLWLCVSDLENPELPVEDHEPELYPAAEITPELPASTGSVSLWLTGSAVAVLCGVTAFLILRMKKRS